MSIPKDISDKENISRIIFTPYHYNKKDKKLKPGAYKPRSNKDEVSVIRFDYSNEDFIKKKGSSMEDDRKKLFGYTKIVALKIRSSHSILTEENSKFINTSGELDKYRVELFYSPNKSNEFHSHLLFFYEPQEDEVLPAQINLLIQELIDNSVFSPIII